MTDIKTVKMTKQQWCEIGDKSGWFAKLASVAYESPMGLHLFEGGSINLGSRGKASITGVNPADKIMNLRLEDGSELVMDMDTLDVVTNLEEHKRAKEEAERVRQEERARRPRGRGRQTGERERVRTELLFGPESKNFFLMGFVASNGTITAQILPSKVVSFEDHYKRVHGDIPEQGSYEVVREEHQKWGNEYRVHISRSKMTDEIKAMFEPIGVTLCETADRNVYDINDRFYVWSLFDVGFVLGNSSKQNPQLIADKIGSKYGDDAKRSFEMGVSVH